MSRSEHWNDEDRSGLEQTSAEVLEELLLRDFRAPEHGEDGMGELYHAAQILAREEPDSGTAADQAWESFQENYLPFARDGGALFEDGVPPSSNDALGRRYTFLRRRWVRTALAAAILAVLLLSVCVAAASDWNLLGALTRWTDERMWLAPGQVTAAKRDEIRIPETPGEYADIREALEDHGLTRLLVPRWMPEGFEPVEVIVDDNLHDMLMFLTLYRRGEDSLVISVSIYLARDDESGRSYTDFQKDEGAPVLYESGGVTHMLSTNAGRPVAMWANGPAECAVSGDITMEELIQMIDSVYE